MGTSLLVFGNKPAKMIRGPTRMEKETLFIPGIPCAQVRELAREIAVSFCHVQNVEEQENLAEQIALAIEHKLNFSEHLNELLASAKTLAIVGHDMRNYLVGFSLESDREYYEHLSPNQKRRATYGSRPAHGNSFELKD